jgi:hypothetical protein
VSDQTQTQAFEKFNYFQKLFVVPSSEFGAQVNNAKVRENCVMFITEIDSKVLDSENSFSIIGYKTIFSKRSSKQSKIRIIGLMSE